MTVTVPSSAMPRALRSAPPAAVLACLLSWSSGDRLATQEPVEELPIPTLLVAPADGNGGRTPFPTSALELRRVLGERIEPRAGDPVDPSRADDPEAPVWERIEAGANGEFRHRRLRGGLAFALLDVEVAATWMLDPRGARSVRVNDAPYAGDLYSLGVSRVPVPLVAGRNRLLFEAGRGRLQPRLLRPEAAVFLETIDRTLPDVVRGDASPLWLGLPVTNATGAWQTGLTIAVEGRKEPVAPVPPLPPYSVTRVAVRTGAPEAGELPDDPEAGHTLTLALRDAEGTPVHRTQVALRVVAADALQVRTFVSRIDGSVQFYAVQPARSGTYGPSAPPGLLLSLHGAGVDARAQAGSYSQKSGVFVVAPTNRRPFGFDWEDWGRLDALEVLADATARFGTDASRTWLTGHSMGGHGTWQLGAHFPDRFAAIAPSAGWRDFRDYGGAAGFDVDDPIGALFERASSPSRTLRLQNNYAARGIYVLHGDRDESVPVGEARAMRALLGGFHPDFAYYERPGAGHWWGAQCLDWPPLIDFVTSRQRPADRDVRHVDFTTVDPALSSRLHWLEIGRAQRFGDPARAEADLDSAARRFTIRTENVARLGLDLTALASPGADPDAAPPLPAGEPLAITLDGQELPPVPWPTGSTTVDLGRDGEGAWRLRDAPPRPWRGPGRPGSFKAAFQNRVLLVYGTQGTEEENAWAFHKARFDADVFRYRGNGALQILADTAFRAVDHPDRNIVLYGHATTNAAWRAVLEAPPLVPEGGRIRIGDKSFTGPDLACLFVAPRAGSAAGAMVGVVGGTGVTGMRATTGLPFFVSGVHWPDWTVFRASVWQDGLGGVVAAGFLDPGGQLGADAAYR